jgi:hypothetical protein
MVIKKCHVALYFTHHLYYLLKEPIKCTSANSFSAIHAVSHFLTYYLPEISPPLIDITEEELAKNKTEIF